MGGFVKIRLMEICSDLLAYGYVCVFLCMICAFLPMRKNWILRIAGVCAITVLVTSFIYSNDPYGLFGVMAGFFLYIFVFHVGKAIEKVTAVLVFCPGYLLDGAFDAALFATGKYCLAIGPSMAPGGVVPTHAVGEKVLVAGREFEVMAVLSPLRPMVSGRDSLAFDLPLVLPADVFTEMWQGSNLRKFYFNVTDEAMEDAQALLSKYQQGAAAGMNVVSRRTMIAQYESQTRASAVMGYAVSIIIALVGVLNFVNSMVTAIIARRREFALIQSVGMTKRQLRQMLAFEGLFYAGLTLLAAYTLGALSVGVFLRAMVTAADGYSTFRFTLFPLVCCTPVLIVTALVIPYLCFRNLERQSIVERLRAVN